MVQAKRPAKHLLPHVYRELRASDMGNQERQWEEMDLQLRADEKPDRGSPQSQGQADAQCLVDTGYSKAGEVGRGPSHPKAHGASKTHHFGLLKAGRDCFRPLPRLWDDLCGGYVFRPQFHRD